MLKLEHINLQDEKGHPLLLDVSFTLPNTGIIAIHANHSTFHHSIAQLLAGIRKPNQGILQYNDHEMRSFDEEERAYYRSTFVSSLFHDFQILKTCSVYENITMGLEYPSERVETELRRFHLYEKQDISAEDLTTREQWNMVLIRCILRQPMMLVFDTESCPLSALELQSFYGQLEELRTSMLIVIVGDQGCYPFCNRIIEFEDGYILSDSLREERFYPQINHSNERFALTHWNLEELYDTFHNFIRWKLRCASILCVAAFICLSTAIFSTTLNISDIQMRLMEKQNSSIIAIEKQAVANDGTIMKNYYDYLRPQDITTLGQHLKDHIIVGYYPVDPSLSSLYIYGTMDYDQSQTLDNYTIIEADSEKEFGMHKLYGTYPQNYYQVALSSKQAYALLREKLNEPYHDSEEQMKKMLGMSVLWYGHVMTISAIFPSSASENSNMELDMAGYNGSTYTYGNMMENSFFVRKGFHEAYPILQMRVYQKSYKRMIAGSKVIASMNGIYALENDVYYFDGETYRYDHELKENEILLDYAMALQLGLDHTNLQNTSETVQDSDVLYKQYEVFAKQWINQEVTIQTYTVDNAPSSSTLMNKKVKIKGIAYPINMLSAQDETLGIGAIYVNPKLSAPYETKNAYIKEAFYHSDNEEDLQQALTYLNKDNAYEAYLANSRILKFFVVDLKEITSFLMIFSISALLAFFVIMGFLLADSIKYMRNRCTIFYLFGEQKSVLQKNIMRYFHMILWMRSLFGWFCATLALGVFILMIYFALSASSSVLWSLALPVLLLIGCVLMVRLIFYVIMKRSHVIEEEFKEL